MELAFWLLGMALFVGIGPMLAPYGPTEIIAGSRQLSPSPRHLMGTDLNGMDVFSRVIASSRVDVGLAVGAGLMTFAVGYPLAIYVGFKQGRVSTLVVRLLDIVQAFPVLVLALVVVSMTGGGLSSLLYVAAFVFIPVLVRVVRSVALMVRGEPFIEAAVACGVRPIVIMARHMVPHTLGVALAQMLVSVQRTVVLVTGLAFLGIGIQPPRPEWGSMLQAGLSGIANGFWWESLFPGLAIVCVVLILNRIGELLKSMMPGDLRHDVAAAVAAEVK